LEKSKPRCRERNRRWRKATKKTTYWHHIDRKVDVRFVETDFVTRKGSEIN